MIFWLKTFRRVSGMEAAIEKTIGCRTAGTEEGFCWGAVLWDMIVSCLQIVSNQA